MESLICSKALMIDQISARNMDAKLVSYME